MGITVHFEGKLKDESSFESLCENAEAFAKEMEWPFSLISEQEVKLERVRDEEDWDYVGPVKGIEIFPHEACEPFRLEFDKDLYIQEFTKTQFAPVQIHVLLVDFLRTNQRLFESVEIIDEGEFFDTNDLDLLNKHMQACNEQLEQYLSQPEKYYGPVKLENGRIVDIMEE